MTRATASSDPISAEGSGRVDKPWGYELCWAVTERYAGKLIHINRGHQLSLQYHVQKEEFDPRRLRRDGPRPRERQR